MQNRGIHLTIFLIMCIRIIGDVSAPLDMTAPIDAASIGSLVCYTALIRLHDSHTDRTSPDASSSRQQLADDASNAHIFLYHVFLTDARFFCLVDRQITQNKKFFQFLLIDFSVTLESECKTTAASRAFPISFS